MTDYLRDNAPLLHALLDYVNKGRIPFHMPGHKQGAGAPESLRQLIGDCALMFDLTEVQGLDNLHHPTAAILKAEQLAAQLYGADHTFFSVNGSSAGIAALVLASCRPGEKILIPRHVHRAFLNALILSGAEPIWLMPEWDEARGMVLGVLPQKVEEILQKRADIRAVFMVHPTYQGVASPLPKIAEAVHRYNLPLLVDAAHGSHFSFHPAFPPSALSAGADGAVESAHKTLGALTQSALLHIRGTRLEKERVAEALRLVQSTSPSYLLMASLDAARQQMGRDGKNRFGRLYQLLQERIGITEKWRKLSLWRQENIPAPFVLDFTKWTIFTHNSNITGYQLADCLRHYGIEVEMAGSDFVLAMLTLADSAQTLDHLLAALSDIDRLLSANPLHGGPLLPPLPPLPPAVCNPREAFFARHERVSKRQAAGRIAAQALYQYPPGIPVVYPGERITAEVLDHMRLVEETGGEMQGYADEQALFVLQ